LVGPVQDLGSASVPDQYERGVVGNGSTVL